MGRPPCCDHETVKKGAWAPEEDAKLVSYVSRHGHANWKDLPKLAGLNRCGKSCRLRWANYLRPGIRRGKFSEKEEQTILRLHSVLGNKWSAIAAQLPGRTDNEVKNHWHTLLKKRLVKIGAGPTTTTPALHHQLMTDLCSKGSALVLLLDLLTSWAAATPSCCSNNINIPVLPAGGDHHVHPLVTTTAAHTDDAVVASAKIRVLQSLIRVMLQPDTSLDGGILGLLGMNAKPNREEEEEDRPSSDDLGRDGVGVAFKTDDGAPSCSTGDQESVGECKSAAAVPRRCPEPSENSVPESDSLGSISSSPLLSSPADGQMAAPNPFCPADTSEYPCTSNAWEEMHLLGDEDSVDAYWNDVLNQVSSSAWQDNIQV